MEAKLNKRLKELNACSTGGSKSASTKDSNLEGRTDLFLEILDDLAVKNPGGYAPILLKLRSGFA